MSFKEELERRLVGGKFRILNEKLYKNKKLTKQESLLYHRYYTEQTKKWPVNPLELIIKKLKDNFKSPKIADLGCGTARLSQLFENVHSFDAFPVADNIEKCDLEKVPLESLSMDVVVCCLSLMKNDVTKVIKEVSRILKIGGTYFIAEIRSRFISVNKFCSQLEEFGFQIVQCDTSNSHFVIFEVKKKKEIENTTATKIMLKPCLYKKR